MIPVVGRCLGAGEKEQARENAGLLMRVAYAGIAAACLLLFAVTPWAVQMFNLSPEAVTIATTVIRSFCVVSIFLWPASFTLPNALRAGGDARFTMTVSMVSMWLFRVIACWVFVKVWGMGLLSVWAGMYIDWGFRVLLFALRYRSNRWMEHEVILNESLCGFHWPLFCDIIERAACAGRDEGGSDGAMADGLQRGGQKRAFTAF